MKPRKVQHNLDKRDIVKAIASRPRAHFHVGYDTRYKLTGVDDYDKTNGKRSEREREGGRVGARVNTYGLASRQNALIL